MTHTWFALRGRWGALPVAAWQLCLFAGGIERYLEAFPSGGAFKGKNFVFDERVVHPNSLNSGDVVGRCLLCNAPHDDYRQRHRCGRCRLLVLVCAQCVEGCAAASGGTAGDQLACMPQGGTTAGDGAITLGNAAEAPSSGDHCAGVVRSASDGSEQELLCRHCMAGRITRRRPLSVTLV